MDVCGPLAKFLLMQPGINTVYVSYCCCWCNLTSLSSLSTLFSAQVYLCAAAAIADTGGQLLLQALLSDLCQCTSVAFLHQVEVPKLQQTEQLHYNCSFVLMYFT